MGKAISLVWYCKTPEGWRRFPVEIGGNGRIKLGWVRVGDQLVQYPQGTFQIRSYKDRQVVYKGVGTNAADAMAAKTRQEHLEVAKGYAKVAGIKIETENSRLSLRKAVIDFENDAKQRNAMVAADVNKQATLEFIAVSGKTYADEVTKQDVFAFHAALRARGCGDRTVSNKHKRLRSFFRFCKLNTDEVMPPAPKFDSRLPDVYSREERVNLLRVADPYMRTVIQLGLMCGLRDREIRHVEWSDIDWEQKVLRVRSKPRWGFRIKDSEERDIPIPNDVLQSLRARRKMQPAGSLIVPNQSGRPNGKLLRTLKHLARDNGLNCKVCDGCQHEKMECQKWTLHKLRRTYATTLLRKGIDLATVQSYMGHSDLASTMRYLSPATAEDSQSAINAISWT